MLLNAALVVALSHLATATSSKECNIQDVPFNYLGCFVDTGPWRPVGGSADQWGNFSSMTVNTCSEICRAKGLRYSGLEYGGQCFCDSSIHSVDKISHDQCNMACTGNATEVCGGDHRMAVYEDSTFKPLNFNATYESYGCYSLIETGEDGSQPLGIGGHRQLKSEYPKTSVQSCLEGCREWKMPFASLQMGRMCYCGHQLREGSHPIPDSECTSKCNGDSSNTCGGAKAINLYFAKDMAAGPPCDNTPQRLLSASSEPTSSTSTSSTISSREPSPSTQTSETTTTSTSTDEQLPPQTRNMLPPMPVFPVPGLGLHEAFGSCSCGRKNCPYCAAKRAPTALLDTPEPTLEARDLTVTSMYSGPVVVVKQAKCTACAKSGATSGPLRPSLWVLDGVAAGILCALVGF